jgi:hypothetical protein
MIEDEEEVEDDGEDRRRTRRRTSRRQRRFNHMTQPATTTLPPSRRAQFRSKFPIRQNSHGQFTCEIRFAQRLFSVTYLRYSDVLTLPPPFTSQLFTLIYKHKFIYRYTAKFFAPPRMPVCSTAVFCTLRSIPVWAYVLVFLSLKLLVSVAGRGVRGLGLRSRIKGEGWLQPRGCR